MSDGDDGVDDRPADDDAGDGAGETVMTCAIPYPRQAYTIFSLPAHVLLHRKPVVVLQLAHGPLVLLVCCSYLRSSHGHDDGAYPNPHRRECPPSIALRKAIGNLSFDFLPYLLGPRRSIVYPCVCDFKLSDVVIKAA